MYKYVSCVSVNKDSLNMLLNFLDVNLPIDEVVFCGESTCDELYEQVKKRLENEEIEYTTNMNKWVVFKKMINQRDGFYYGYFKPNSKEGFNSDENLSFIINEVSNGVTKRSIWETYFKQDMSYSSFKHRLSQLGIKSRQTPLLTKENVLELLQKRYNTKKICSALKCSYGKFEDFCKKNNIEFHLRKLPKPKIDDGVPVLGETLFLMRKMRKYDNCLRCDGKISCKNCEFYHKNRFKELDI